MATDVTDLTTDEGKFDSDAAGQLIDETIEKNTPPEAETEATAEPQAGEERATSEDAVSEDDASAEDRTEEPEENALTEDMQELIASLGLSEEEAQAFSGADELQRHALLLDKRLMQMKPGEVQEAVLESQKLEESTEQEEPAAEQPRGKDGKFVSPDANELYDVGLDPDLYDEDVVTEFQKMSHHFEGRILKLEKMLLDSEDRYNEMLQTSERQQQDVVLDGIGHDDLFGDSSKSISKAQRENREKVLQTVRVLQAGMEALGTEVARTPALIRRAINLEFADKLSEKQRRELSGRIRKQGSRVLGGGRSSSQQRSDLTSPEAELIEAWKEMEREAGNR